MLGGTTRRVRVYHGDLRFIPRYNRIQLNGSASVRPRQRALYQWAARRYKPACAAKITEQVPVHAAFGCWNGCVAEQTRLTSAPHIARLNEQALAHNHDLLPNAVAGDPRCRVSRGVHGGHGFRLC